MKNKILYFPIIIFSILTTVIFNSMMSPIFQYSASVNYLFNLMTVLSELTSIGIFIIYNSVLFSLIFIDLNFIDYSIDFLLYYTLNKIYAYTLVYFNIDVISLTILNPITLGFIFYLHNKLKKQNPDIKTSINVFCFILLGLNIIFSFFVTKLFGAS